MNDTIATLMKGFRSVTGATLFQAALTLVICLAALRLLIKLLDRLLNKSSLDPQVRRYLLTGAKVLGYVVTVMIVAEALHVKMSSMVALLSVGSLGITLAAEDILGNVAGGLVILSSRPFSIGDYIEAGGVSGTVHEISLNHTKLVTADGSLIMLPNRELAGSKMTNYSVLGRRRITRTVTASYDAPTDVVKAACQQALKRTPGILEDPAPSVYLTDYQSSAIQYTIYCWSAPEDFLTVSFTLGEALRDSFQEARVEMTYDHLNVHIIEESPKKIQS